jgi:voltage-gated potassium channel
MQWSLNTLASKGPKGMRVKKRVYEVLETSSTDNKASRIDDYFLTTLILINVIAVMLETIEELSLRYSLLFGAIEIFSVIVFTLEYILRLWCCDINPRFKRPVMGRIKFALTPMAIIDLLAILPFYLPMLLPLDLRFVRSLRLFRLFRLFKMARYSESMRTIMNVTRSRKEELAISVFVVVVLLVFSSSFIYYAEHESQPEAFSSIPASMWWGVTTLTTVGYGDVYPVTYVGRIFGAVIAILGIGMFALPTGIRASGFSEEMQKKRKHQNCCPHCGKEIS